VKARSLLRQNRVAQLYAIAPIHRPQMPMAISTPCRSGYLGSCHGGRVVTKQPARKIAAKKTKPAAPVHLPFQEPCADCDTEQERWQFSVGRFAGDAIALKAFFDKHFPAWREYPAPPETLTLVNQAAESWRALAGDLKARKG
jgi:hypothetical protein